MSIFKNNLIPGQFWLGVSFSEKRLHLRICYFGGYQDRLEFMRKQMSLQFIQHEFIFRKIFKNILPPFFPIFGRSLILY